MQCPLTPRKKRRTIPNSSKFQSHHVQTTTKLCFIDTSSKTQKKKSLWNIWRRSSGSSWKKFARTPTCWPLVGKTVRGSSVGTRMGKVPTWECLFVHRKQGYFCQYVWMTSKWLEESRVSSHVEEIDETCWSWRTNIISWPRIFMSRTGTGDGCLFLLEARASDSKP